MRDFRSHANAFIQRGVRVNGFADIDGTCAHVSASNSGMNYVATKFGVAQLRGESAGQRGRELIGIAHPNFRAELTEQAKRMRVI